MAESSTTSTELPETTGEEPAGSGCDEADGVMDASSTEDTTCPGRMAGRRNYCPGVCVEIITRRRNLKRLLDLLPDNVETTASPTRKRGDHLPDAPARGSLASKGTPQARRASVETAHCLDRKYAVMNQRSAVELPQLGEGSVEGSPRV